MADYQRSPVTHYCQWSVPAGWSPLMPLFHSAHLTWLYGPWWPTAALGHPKYLSWGSIWWFLYSSSERASCNWMLPGFLVCFNIFIIEFLLKIFVRCIFILCCGSAQPNVPRRIPCYLALLPGDKIGFPGLRPAWQLLGPRLLLLTSKLLLLFATHNYVTCNTSGSKPNVLNQHVLMNAKN